MSGAEPKDPWDALRSLPMGRRVEITDGARTWTGTIVPRHELSGDRILPLKLESGYNVGIRIGPSFGFRLMEDGPADEGRSAGTSDRPSSPVGGAPVALLTTGGTIASRVDYETGGVRPVKDESGILAFFPDLERDGPVRIVPVFDRLSEDLAPEDWVAIASKVVEAFGAGARGVVIAHGTDTLGFTAAALSFLLVDLPGPVVVAGAQRSPDRPSSDGATNLGGAVAVGRERGCGEVVVVMHAGPSDDRLAIHRATWVRKMHSSRRDAFQSRNGPPLGYVVDGSIRWEQPVRPPAAGPARLDGPLDARAGLLWFYPGLTADRAEAFSRGLRGIVLAGTGLGHVGSNHLTWIRSATARGMVVAMTTQCLAGNADPYVYATGRELLRSGVLYLGDLLPETAYAKLCWALGHAADPKRVEELLRTDRAGEFHDRHAPEAAP